MASRIVPFIDGMKIGLGYNRLSGDVLPTPSVQGTSISSVQAAGGQQVTVDCTTIQDVETLHKSLGISVDAGGSYMGFSGSTKVDYANSCDFSSFSTYVLIRVSVKDATETIDSPTFSPDANELLVNNNPDRFRQRFGDTFIAGILKGGEYFAIYQITSSDETEKESVAVKVHAAFNGLLASAELNTSINTATSQSKSHLEVKVHVFRQGTISTADINIEDIMKTAKQFPVAVSADKAFPYAVLLQDYDGLKNPNDQFAYVDIKNRQDVLEDLAKKRFEFLALRDDLKYILKHSDDFQNTDGTSVDRNKLIQDFNDVVNAINTMQHQASLCTRDANQCNFTKFDVAKFKLPIPKVTKLIRVPNMMNLGLLGSIKAPPGFTLTMGFRIDPPAGDRIAHIARQTPPLDSLAPKGSTITLDYFWPDNTNDPFKGRVFT
ncbi:hypothetical protein NIES4075_66690 [Tolypothrix sp. NIES-4075]|nr:hypothetical protein NIES4075_66690 [Tolypothrix sp. NIES-4075]